MKRCFIAINIPKNIKNKIYEIQNQLPEFIGKKTKLENLHLTLKFLGEINEDKIEKIKEKLKQTKFKKFNTTLDEVGVFSEKFIKILWLHLTNCTELQKQIDNSLQDLFKPEFRFMSHITIARVKKIQNKNQFLENLKKIKIPEIKFHIDKFYLMSSELSSQDPKYKIIEEYNLVD